MYGGVRRFVEPYALVFKRRQDGVRLEYFYAWDLVGGSSGPGIKAFIPEKVQALALTDQEFVPRFLIELTKDGAGSSGTFARPFSSGPRVSSFDSSRRRTSAEYRYRIRCPYCGKVFKRKTRSTKLNKHTNGYGSQCYGRVGVPVF